MTSAAILMCCRDPALRSRRIPLAKPWLAAHVHAQGLSIARLARKLRISDVSVRNYLRRDAGNRERLRADALLLLPLQALRIAGATSIRARSSGSWPAELTIAGGL